MSWQCSKVQEHPKNFTYIVECSDGFAGVEQWKPFQMAAGLGIAAAGWAVKRIWETIAKRKAEEEERIARHKDEVFSIWMNCGASMLFRGDKKWQKKD